MALDTNLVTVGVTATLLSASQADRAPGASLAIKIPTGGQTVYIGGANVTASGAKQGWPVGPGESLFLDLDTSPGNDLSTPMATEAVYAIVAATTQAINTLLRGL
jgi:hypothetical protein